MIGRQVIKSGRTWESKEELFRFMEENWDKEEVLQGYTAYMKEILGVK